MIIDTKAAAVDDKCNKIEEELNKDVEILKEALDNNRELFTNKLNSLVTQNENYHKISAENLEKVMDAAKYVKENVNNLDQKIRESAEELNQKLL